MTHPIAHAHTPRPDTGVNNTQLGMWLFLASDIMLMASLLSAHVLLRASATMVPDLAPSWMRLFIEASLLFATLFGLMRASPADIGRGGPSGPPWAGLKPRPYAKGILRRASNGAGLLLASSLLALVCAAVQIAELASRFSAGVRPAQHVLIASWFTLVSAHVLHVIAGACLIGWMSRQFAHAGSPQFHARVHAVKVYWYVVVATWIVLVVVCRAPLLAVFGI